MNIYKLNTQEIQELFVIKSNGESSQDLHEFLDSLRLKFIDLCKQKEDWAIEYLTEDKESISDDIFKDHTLPGGHIMFYIWNNRLNHFPDLKKEFFHIIGETPYLQSW